MAGQVRTGRWKRLAVVAIVIAAVALVGGPYVYIHFIEAKAPPPLALTLPSSTTAAAGSNVTPDGTWEAIAASTVGYRVQETLFGQSNEAAGRTTDVTGSLTIEGTSVTEATFTVDLTTVTSDQSRRDQQFTGRIMETATYPTATFTLTEPIDLGSIPSAGEQRTFRATGDLTLHGVTKSVTFELTGQLSGSTVQIAGSIPILFADWNISNPSFGPAQTEDQGMLEFLLTLAHA